MAKRRLSDLYVIGKELTLDDGGGPVTVWVQKLNLLDQTEAAKRADAARARVLSLRHHPEATEYQAISADAYGIGGKDALLDYLLLKDRSEIHAVEEVKLATDEEWSKDGYLDGLRTAWIEGGVQARWLEDKDDEEANRVFVELSRFDTQVSEIVESQLEARRDTYAARSEEDLLEEAISRLIDLRASGAWLDEFYRCQVFYGVRDPDNHAKRYFESWAELEALSIDVYRQLRVTYESLEVPVMEGKDSPAAPASSPPSEQSAEEETSPSSGPVAVPA